MAREVWRIVIHKEATLEIDTDETTIEQAVEDNLLYDLDIEYDLLERDQPLSGRPALHNLISDLKNLYDALDFSPGIWDNRSIK